MTEIGPLLPHGDNFPELSRSAWVAPGAYVVGDVRLAEESSVWYGAVLRGDTEPIQVGARTNGRRPRPRGKGVPAPQPHSRCPYEACQRR